MTQILIIEGDSPQQLSVSARQGLPSNARYYSDAAQRCREGLQSEIVQPYAADFNLQRLDLAAVDGVIFSGSTVNWSVDAPEAKPLRQTLEKVFRAGKPVLGSCNGLQLGTLVLGGKVAPSPHGLEIGLARDIRLTAAGRQHPLHAGRADRFTCSCIHRDEVSELPAGAVLTAGNAHSPVQAMVYEQGDIRFWGVQYHPEISAAQIADIIAADGLFSSSAELAAALRAAHAAPRGDAAQRLGVRGNDLLPAVRVLELANWLAMVGAAD